MDSELLVTKLLWIMKRLTFLEKKTGVTSQGFKLYASEIHLMLLIDDERGVNATKMAEKFGVTKGAISQTLSRLEKKGILEKTKDPYNKNELTITFTSAGKEALKQFQAVRESLRNQFNRYFSSLNADERTLIEQFMEKLEEILDCQFGE